MSTGVRSPAARSRRQTSSPSTPGMSHVEDDRVRAALGQRVERGAAVGGELDVVALQAQGAVEGRADGGLVVDDQDAHRGRLWQGEPKGR